MANERKTEKIIRNLLKEKGYTIKNNFIVEEQQSDNPTIQRLLSNASKNNLGNQGYPEFIISKINNLNNLIIIIECKAKIENHIGKSNVLKPQDYAVDGVLHYASFLNKEYNVIAIAASGQFKNDICIDSFFIGKQSTNLEVISTGTIYTYEQYIKKINSLKR